MTLLQLLADQEPGPVPGSAKEEVEKLLADAWPGLREDSGLRMMPY